MQLKNNTAGNVQLFYPVVKNKIPDVDYIHIPARATVELADEIFAKLLKPLTTIRVQRESVSEIEGEAEVKMDKRALKIKDYFETGETRVVNLFKEQINSGDFTIVEHPVISTEAMIAVLNQNGVAAKDMGEDAIKALYAKLV